MVEQSKAGKGRAGKRGSEGRDPVRSADDAVKEKTGAEPGSERVGRTMGANVLLDGRYMPPPADGDGKLWVRTSALIKGEPETLYGIWHNVETAPLWQEQIMSVTRTGEKTSHRVMQSANGTTEWDAELTADEPGRRSAWRPHGGDPENACRLALERAPGGRQP